MLKNLNLNEKFLNNLIKKGKKEKAFKLFFFVMCKLKRALKLNPSKALIKAISFCAIYLELILKVKRKKPKVIARNVKGRYLLVNSGRAKRKSIKNILLNIKKERGEYLINKLVKELFYIVKLNYRKSNTLKKKLNYLRFLKKSRPSSFIAKKKSRRKKINKL